VLPTPLIITNTVQFARASRCATLGRLHADGGSLSDPIALLRVVEGFIRFMHTAGGRQMRAQLAWCEEQGLHLRRLKRLLRTISEVAKRLTPAMGNSALQQSLLHLQHFCNFAEHKSRDIAESAEQAEGRCVEGEMDAVVAAALLAARERARPILQRCALSRRWAGWQHQLCPRTGFRARSVTPCPFDVIEVPAESAAAGRIV
jgi:hypothetical protein